MHEYFSLHVQQGSAGGAAAAHTQGGRRARGPRRGSARAEPGGGGWAAAACGGARWQGRSGRSRAKLRASDAVRAPTWPGGLGTRDSGVRPHAGRPRGMGAAAAGQPRWCGDELVAAAPVLNGKRGWEVE